MNYKLGSSLDEILDFLEFMHSEADNKCIASILQITSEEKNKKRTVSKVTDTLYPIKIEDNKKKANKDTFFDEAIGLIQCKAEDCYFSINNFWAKYDYRRTDNIRNLNAFVIDYDFYKKAKYKDLDPQTMYENHIEKTLPFPPTAVIDSGRGLYVIYVFNKASSKAIKLYKSIYKVLINNQLKFGADPLAGLVTQVIRIPGTYNSKSHSCVNILEFNPQNKYILEQLATILPFTLEEVNEYKKVNYKEPVLSAKITNLKETNEIASKQKRAYQGSHQADIINDLKKLIHLRNVSNGGLEGYREQIIYIARTALKSLEMDNTNELMISKQLNNMFNDPLTIKEFDNSLPCHSKFNHTCHSIAKIIRNLEITNDEQEELKTLCSSVIKARKRLESLKYSRKKALLNMSDKELEMFKRRSEVAKLNKMGKSIRAIANKLVVSKSLVEKDILYIKEHKYQFIKKLEVFLDELYALVRDVNFMHTLTISKQKSYVEWSKTIIAVLE